MMLLNFLYNFLVESVMSVSPVLHRKYTPRYFILPTQGITLSFMCISQALGLGPPNVIN